jgi:hypothetical protein
MRLPYKCRTSVRSPITQRDLQRECLSRVKSHVLGGDRIQFRAPFTEQRVANGEPDTIEQIKDRELTVALDTGLEVNPESDKFRHIDYCYAVTSYSSKSPAVDRVLVKC